MKNRVIWSFDQDWEYTSECELWIERAFVLRVTCNACESWMIPTTHSAIDLPEQTLALLNKNYKRHVSPADVEGILKLIPQAGMRLYAGAALGQARVIRFTGQLSNAFAWGAMTPILNENDFFKIKSRLGSKLEGRTIENLENDLGLFELVRVPIDLDRIYPEKLCSQCGQPNTEKISGEEVRKIVNSVTEGEGIFEVPGGNLLVNEDFKAAVEGLGLKNAVFREFALDSYLKEFKSVC